MAQKLATPYHLLLEREQLLTSGFHAQMTLMACHLCAEVREAQAAIVEAGVGRRADLGRMKPFPRFPPPPGGPRLSCVEFCSLTTFFVRTLELVPNILPLCRVPYTSSPCATPPQSSKAPIAHHGLS